MAVSINGTSGLTFNDGTSVGTASSLGMRNRIINGAMEIDQRAATVTVNAAGPLYSVDRWGGTGETADGVFTLAKTAAGPAGFPASLKATVTTADASIGASQRYIIQQRIEGNNIADLAWGSASAKTVTLSFWVFSSLTGTFGGFFRNSAGDRNYVFSYAVSAANTWEYKSIVVPGDTAGTWLTDNGIGVILAFAIGAGSDRVGTAGVWSANNHQAPTGQTQLISTNGATFYLTGVQLEVGSVATPFERRLYPVELELAQRYCQIIVGSNTGAGYFASGTNNGTAQARATCSFRTTMRSAPTASFASAGSFVVQAGSSTYTPSGVGLVAASPNAMVMFATISGATNGQGAMIGDATTSATLLTLTAEL